MIPDGKTKLTQKAVSGVNQSLITSILIIILFIGFMACKTDDNIAADQMDEEVNDGQNADSTSSRLTIRIGTQTFKATLLSNPTVTAFKARLPMTIGMSELNGNEKLHNFPSNLPANASNPKIINTGDLMLYGSDTLVLFYKSFPTSYSYTRLGKVDDRAGLAAAVGPGNVTVTFEIE